MRKSMMLVIVACVLAVGALSALPDAPAKTVNPEGIAALGDPIMPPPLPPWPAPLA